MTSRKLIEAKLIIDNALYWQQNGEETMASKPCPIHGYVDKSFDGCVGCRQCTEGK